MLFFQQPLHSVHSLQIVFQTSIKLLFEILICGIYTNHGFAVREWWLGFTNVFLWMEGFLPVEYSFAAFSCSPEFSLLGAVFEVPFLATVGGWNQEVHTI